MHPERLSASAAARAIRAGTLKASELLEACLERIAAREGEVQAWEQWDVERARAEARRLDCVPPSGLLHGIPIGVKDIIDTLDFPTACGSPIYQGRRVAADAACVALARRAGAIILGKTVTTEFAYFSPGRTHNPHAPGHTPGGSSSGSAAAVADCMVPVALGTQTAGSITRPASYCGVVGYKPSFGDFSLAGVKSLAPSLDTLGTLTRCVEDAALLRAVLLGDGKAPVLPALPVLPQAPRIALCRTPSWPLAEPSTQAGIEDSAARLARRGARLGEVTLPPLCTGLVEAQKRIMAYEAARSLAFEYDRHGARLSAPLRELIELGMGLPRADYLAALAVAEQSRTQVAALFGEWDALLAPAAPGEAPAGLGATGDPVFSRMWTLLGLPSVALPAFRGAHGLPVAIQVLGPLRADDRLLAVAQWVEAALAG
ncbi:MAG TPA: amidase [Candidatus Competibacteraceae bacterium]|nr:amidase [Candidatus Competibacteraceae bacterium]